MAVALRSPERVSALIPVDNAPVNAALKSDFPKYVRGMQKVEAEKVSKQSDANKILEDYEEVRLSLSDGSKTYSHSIVPSNSPISPHEPD